MNITDKDSPLSHKSNYKRTTIRDLLNKTTDQNNNNEDAIYYNDDDDDNDSIGQNVMYTSKYFSSNNSTQQRQTCENDDDNDEVIILDNHDKKEENKRKRVKKLNYNDYDEVEEEMEMGDVMSRKRVAGNGLRQNDFYHYGQVEEEEDFYTQVRLWNLEEKVSLTNFYSCEYVKFFEDGTGECENLFSLSKFA